MLRLLGWGVHGASDPPGTPGQPETAGRAGLAGPEGEAGAFPRRWGRGPRWESWPEGRSCRGGREDSADKLAAAAPHRPHGSDRAAPRPSPAPRGGLRQRSRSASGRRAREGTAVAGIPKPLGFVSSQRQRTCGCMFGTGFAWCCSALLPSKGKRAVFRRRGIGRTFFSLFLPLK